MVEEQDRWRIGDPICGRKWSSIFLIFVCFPSTPTSSSLLSPLNEAWMNVEHGAWSIEASFGASRLDGFLRVSITASTDEGDDLGGETRRLHNGLPIEFCDSCNRRRSRAQIQSSGLATCERSREECTKNAVSHGLVVQQRWRQLSAARRRCQSNTRNGGRCLVRSVQQYFQQGVWSWMVNAFLFSHPSPTLLPRPESSLCEAHAQTKGPNGSQVTTQSAISCTTRPRRSMQGSAAQALQR